MDEHNRGDTGSPFLTPRNAPAAPDHRFDRQKITLAILLVLALATVFLLPRFVDSPWLGGAPDAAAPLAPAANAVSPSTAAEKTRYRQEAQTVLAQIIAVRDRLRARNVVQWADIEFGQALAQIQEGDEQYSYGEYGKSLGHYQQALEQLTALEAAAQDKLAQALADGVSAVESLNVNVAITARELALMLAPDDPETQELAARVDSLPRLAELIELGDLARAQGRLDEARAAYQEAAALDSQHRRAADAAASIRAEITDSRFRAHMSRGYAALDNGQYEAALAAFDEAETVYPGHAAIAQARAQLANRDAQQSVSRRMQRAAALEGEERWAEAMVVYESLLEEDPSLADARARALPVRVRAQLDAQLESLIAEPLKLAGPTAHRNAQQVLEDARGIARPGARLQGQVAELDRLLKLALHPVNVEFRSDNQTIVTLYRVKELGQFEQATLTLRPGRYTAGGRRPGYRDVHVEFTVTGEPLDEPIIVRCEEPI